MDSALMKYCYEELVQSTDQFNKDGFIGKTQFGKVYRGKLESRNSRTTSSHNFGWLHRVKVIIHMALFIEYLHAHNPQYLIRNIDARHLMLDEVIASSHLTDGYNLKVLDFSMFLGGTFQDLVKTPFHRFAFVGSFGYKDFPTLYRPNRELGPWSDIFAFGILVLTLISKRAYDPEEEEFYHELHLHVWAEEQYERRIKRVGRNKRCPKYSKFSLVHKSLLSSKGFSGRDGFTLTKLAMQCVDNSFCERPSINEVVDSLLKLRTVRRHGSDLDIDHLLCLRKQCA
ncbi:hypothetical protein CDL15_Pgr023373 [Punica granatum]|uniref:Protein kinase domain-containing protein n=1 Tax=Punica granatum TaxID=22663 RepID=A0A218Y1S3_PUNGR|nr:hypothetical protein CDL15_Pgr023373 [Punica granatum]